MILWMVIEIPISRRKSSHNFTSPCRLHFSNWCLNLIKGAIDRYPIYNTLYKLTLSSCPSPYYAVPWTAHHFWGSMDELSIDNCISLKGTRICFPPELWHILVKLTSGPQKYWTHSTLSWPWIDANIADYVKRCFKCIQHMTSQTTQSMLTGDILMVCGKELLIFFSLDGHDHLLICDPFSKYLFLFKVPIKTAQITKYKFVQIFTHYGPPKHLYTNNGQPSH